MRCDKKENLAAFGKGGSGELGSVDGDCWIGMQKTLQKYA